MPLDGALETPSQTCALLAVIVALALLQPIAVSTFIIFCSETITNGLLMANNLILI